MVYKTASQGAASFLVAALDPSLNGTQLCRADLKYKANKKLGHPGAFIDDCQIKETPKYAHDEAVARRLWTLAESWATSE